MPKNTKALLEALNEAISAELMAVTQYMWHHVMASGLSAPAVSEQFKKASIDEMKHAEKLAERLNYLGGVPTTKPKPIKVGGDLKKMLKDNLGAEHAAITMYKRFIKLCADDSTTRRLFEEILAEEEEHADIWETVLDIQK